MILTEERSEKLGRKRETHRKERKTDRQTEKDKKREELEKFGGRRKSRKESQHYDSLLQINPWITDIKATHHIYLKNSSFLWLFPEGRKEKQSPIQYQLPSWVSLCLGSQPAGFSLSWIHISGVINLYLRLEYYHVCYRTPEESTHIVSQSNSFVFIMSPLN